MRHIFILFIFSSLHALSQLVPQSGVKQSTPSSIAFTRATIVCSPEKTLEDATLIISGDQIKAVGKNLAIPAGTLVINCEGKTILPAFIESFSSVGEPKSYTRTVNKENPLQHSAYYWNPAIHPELDAGNVYQPDLKANEELQKMGFGFALTHLGDGIARGTGALVSLATTGDQHALVQPNLSQHYSFEKGTSEENYPSAQMGAIALLRQTFYDMQWYAKTQPSEYNVSLDKLNKSSNLPFIFQVKDHLEVLRAQAIATEFNYQFNILGGGDEYVIAKQLKNSKHRLIIPLNFPAAYNTKDPYISRQLPLSTLKHWELAPSNAAILAANKVSFCLSSYGVKGAADFWKNVRLAIERGLTVQQALAALTTEPAKMLQLDASIGTLDSEKRASFFIYDNNPFTKEGKLLEAWLLGKQTILKTNQAAAIEGTYSLLLENKKYPLTIKGTGEKLTASLLVKNQAVDTAKQLAKSDTVKIDVAIQLTGTDVVLQFTLNNDDLKGSVQLHGKVAEKLGIFEGDGLLPTGKWIQWSAIRNGKPTLSPQTPAANTTDTAYSDKLWYPNCAYGFPAPAQKQTLVIRNATVWTNEASGILNDATVIVVNGKITYIGTGNFTFPPNALEIDAKGKVLTSGIIDEHSHIAISKGVNEGGQAVSAEVRIGDVLDPEDISIYRQLAGGVTAAQLLHGSANPIGGQSALIKLKWGVTPEQLLIPNAPKFIKFALGENVKQGYSPYSTRFPQTRMGVEQVFYDAFYRARAYQGEWDAFAKGKKNTAAPRKDLELEALTEIMLSNRFITCHSYVQSEINMLMHVADSMGIRINTFTHILEGYKVADKMYKHGAGASTFSDWWGYKYEVKEAIPYNAFIMQQQGLVVAINSDDDEMGRRLNQEAAKSVKYGGMTEAEAWKMVTLNPAKLLHLDDRMGSIKVGKDADLVLWTSNPLSIEAKVELTIVDGTVYFDATRDSLMRIANEAEKARILSKMQSTKQTESSVQPFVNKKKHTFHCNTLGEEAVEAENEH